MDKTSKPTDGPPALTPPSGWLTVDAALAWIAFRSTGLDWNQGLYFGASRWFDACPQAIKAWLAEVREGGFDAFVQTEFAETELGQALVAEAGKRRQSSPLPPTSNLTAEQLSDAAGHLLATVEAEFDEAETRHAAIWKAAEDLRRAIGNGTISPHGFQGRQPDPFNPPLPRQRIPPDACNAPVTVSQAGILSLARGDGSGGRYTVLWSGLLFDAGEVLAVWPAANGADLCINPPISPLVPTSPALTHLPTPRPEYSSERLAGWFMIRVNGWPSAAPFPSEAMDQADAKLAFSGAIPRGEFRKIRAAKTPPEWRKSGPRKSR